MNLGRLFTSVALSGGLFVSGFATPFLVAQTVQAQTNGSNNCVTELISKLNNNPSQQGASAAIVEFHACNENARKEAAPPTTDPNPPAPVEGIEDVAKEIEDNIVEDIEERIDPRERLQLSENLSNIRSVFNNGYQCMERMIENELLKEEDLDLFVDFTNKYFSGVNESFLLMMDRMSSGLWSAPEGANNQIEVRQNAVLRLFGFWVSTTRLICLTDAAWLSVKTSSEIVSTLRPASTTDEEPSGENQGRLIAGDEFRNYFNQLMTELSANLTTVSSLIFGADGIIDRYMASEPGAELGEVARFYDTNERLAANNWNEQYVKAKNLLDRVVRRLRTEIIPSLRITVTTCFREASSARAGIIPGVLNSNRQCPIVNPSSTSRPQWTRPDTVVNVPGRTMADPGNPLIQPQEDQTEQSPNNNTVEDLRRRGIN